MSLERLREAARMALEAPAARSYCIRRYDERGNAFHEVDWDAVSRVFACTVYVRPGYSRRLIAVPGAVVAYVADGLRRYCAEYRTPEQVEAAISQITPSWEIHVGLLSNDVEFARAVCLR
jgi:hypothetical protein